MSIPVECRALIKGLLGSNANIYTAVAVKVYYAKPDPTQWTDVALVGALTLSSDITSNCLFFKLVDLESEIILWQYQLKSDLDYVQDLPYFHSFPGEDCMIGFCFAKTAEAVQFFELVHKKVSILKTETTKSSTQIPAVPSSSKGKRPQIGAPVGFKHVSHVGFDPEHGFSVENVPDDWKTIFSQAGITQEQLQNKETASFIYEFMNKNQTSPETEPIASKDRISFGDRAQASTSVTRPPLPSRPPPSTPKKQPPLPPPLPPSPTFHKSSPSLAPSAISRSPSPLPPPLKSPSSPNLTSSIATSPPSSPMTRDLLMSSIRASGLHTLKPSDTIDSPSSSPSIQSQGSHPTDLMASLLKKALDDRSKHLNTRGSTTTQTSDDDW